ncbi:GNAT family N-acetyltransferase [Planococcus shixiaomingii]|uniref:GNAT family N-acetyltransferase n=1 Tax=Planococcus shixiaomingii TaxID=3058393 RepID=UPI00260E5CC2|nr:GNAT family N-acetyltransferase [Planococcus sp. N022]WKA56036.1 GNAT family N-acetyltransferase [Planococcus sp. N022]
MGKLRFEKGYREDNCLRESFCKLANQIFGLNFGNWYKSGFWGERYIPFSFIDGGEVVANVSVNKVDLLIEGKVHPSLQIGTVMTHSDYRNQGLSRKLMGKVLEEFEGKYDIMYLFANESVMDFYPKFGFHEIQEQQFSAFFNGIQTNRNNIRKLDVANLSDLQWIQEIVYNRVPVSSIFSTANSAGITMYHVLNVFTDHIYYSGELGALIIFERQGQQLELFDVISKKPVTLRTVLAQIADENTQNIVFHFTPDVEGLNLEKKPFQSGEALFVRENGLCSYLPQVMHPVTSKA